MVWREFRLRRRAARDGRRAWRPLWVSVVQAGRHARRVILYAALRFAGGRVGTSFPISGIILGVAGLVYSLLTRNTTVGRHIYAVGGNARAAELSGVKLRSGSTSSS